MLEKKPNKKYLIQFGVVKYQAIVYVPDHADLQTGLVSDAEEGSVSENDG